MKLKLIIAILTVIIVVAIGVSVYFFPEIGFFLMIGYGFFIFFTLVVSWQHPKWYVKLYTVICSIWELFFWCFGGYFVSIVVYPIGLTVPLIPLWYYWYKSRYRMTEAERREILGDQVTELKEQLDRGAITQEEYDHVFLALADFSTGIITRKEYEQKKKKLLEKNQAR